MSKTKVLLITGFFPPYAPLGAVRAPKLARFLLRKGYEVRVIAAYDSQFLGISERELPEEHVHHLSYTEPGESVTRLIQRLRTGLVISEKDTTASAGVKPVPRPQSKPSSLRQLYRQLILFPDRLKSWVHPAVQHGLELAHTWRPDIVYSSCPPHAGHMVAARLSHALGVPWIAELRDLWANNPYSDLNPLVQSALDWVANSTLRQAQACVAVTVTACREIESTIHRPTVLSYNGFDDQDFAGLDQVTPLDPERLTIIHAGVIYAGRRDPTALFQALALLGEERHAVRLQFFHDEGESINGLARQLGVRDCVEIRSPVPRSEILRLERQVDVLLLCRWDNPAEDGIIPGKLFEYIGARRPVLSLGSLTGEAADIVRNGNFGLVSNDPMEIAQALRAWIAEKRSEGGRLADLSGTAAAAYQRDVQFEKIASLIETTVQ